MQEAEQFVRNVAICVKGRALRECVHTHRLHAGRGIEYFGRKGRSEEEMDAFIL